MKKLTGREELFCRLYVSCRNSREAAFRAGYKVCPEITSRKLLTKPAVREAVERMKKDVVFTSDEVKAGLHRIAFASSADAIRLLVCDDYENLDIEDLDLFNISEIKRPKGGGLEIKFFDRVKALEKLGELSDVSQENSAVPFYEALEKSAASLSGGAE